MATQHDYTKHYYMATRQKYTKNYHMATRLSSFLARCEVLTLRTCSSSHCSYLKSNLQNETMFMSGILTSDSNQVYWATLYQITFYAQVLTYIVNGAALC